MLNLWALSRNGWANDYYSAAVRSMSTSWHNFLFASLDPSGVMTVDKPPLALWVQALSVRVFGYHPLSMLVPQALMGIAAVALAYDLVRRRFGRLGGFVAGLALALTPITVAIFRYNKPDALLVLCSVAALWFTVRGLEDGRTRWLVLAGVCVGLGFETKMLVALVVVPGIAAAWLWCAPRRTLAASHRGPAAGRRRGDDRRRRRLAAARRTDPGREPALGLGHERQPRALADLRIQRRRPRRRPGRRAGRHRRHPVRRRHRPAAAAQLGARRPGRLAARLRRRERARAAVATRLRRADARTGWLLAVGGAFVTTAVLFSFASGIFHPYYVSLLAPFLAALVGAGAAHFVRGREGARVFGPLAIVAGVATELAVLGDYPGQLRWLVPVLIGLCGLAAVVLAVADARRLRLGAALLAAGVLLIGPSIWAVDTLGRTLNGTFPEGGPGAVAGSGFGGPGLGRSGARAAASRPAPASAAGSSRSRAPAGFAGPGRSVCRAAPRAPGGFAGPGRLRSRPASGSRSGGGGPAAAASGTRSARRSSSYVKAHGGGTIAVSSQSSAAGSIISDGAEVAGIGGFSGRESDVSVELAGAGGARGQDPLGARRRRLVDGHARRRRALGSRARFGRRAARSSAGSGSGASDGSARSFGGRPGDGREGSRKAIAAAAKACVRVSVGGAGSLLLELLGRHALRLPGPRRGARSDRFLATSG